MVRRNASRAQLMQALLDREVDPNRMVRIVESSFNPLSEKKKRLVIDRIEQALKFEGFAGQEEREQIIREACGQSPPEVEKAA
jgi:hypothetical protein